jgi:hypothetical protein
MAKSRMTLAEIMAAAPDVDLAKIDATTEQDVPRHVTELGAGPDPHGPQRPSIDDDSRS